MAAHWLISGRFQVVGYLGDSDDGIETCSTREEAFTVARNSVSPRQYDRCIVYDLMARRGAPNRWDHEGNILGRRTC